MKLYQFKVAAIARPRELNRYAARHPIIFSENMKPGIHFKKIWGLSWIDDVEPLLLTEGDR